MGERITITASDGFTLNAYRAEPEGKPRGGVVVIQEVWGLNTFVRSVVDRYASEGYLAVAPAMFDRLDFGYESDNYTPEQFAIIGGMMKQFDHQTALLDVAAAVDTAKSAGKVGITGFLLWRRSELARGALRFGPDGGFGLLRRWGAKLYRPGTDHAAGNALWRSGYRHSA